MDINPFTIYAVNQHGEQLRGGAGNLNPINIDMSKIVQNGASTMADLVKEINEKLDLAPSRERAAIGRIEDNEGAQIPGEYLLNNIQLLARSKVDNTANDEFTFELDLQGNSYFGSKIEILDVKTADDAAGANAQNVLEDELPPIFELEKGINTSTGNKITVQRAGQDRVITLGIRITGDNGVVNFGAVSFKANSLIEVNERIAFDSTLDGGVGARAIA